MHNNPIQDLNSYFNALKGNVQATQQIMQAAQQGQPVGLAGLGAMAAKQYQDDAAHNAQVQQAQQGMPPTILAQKLNSSGIMGQFQPNVELSQAPAMPDMQSMEPQQMAMGGIVALNDGGFVDYGYDGGEGYARGGSLDDSEVDEDAFWENDTGADEPSLGDIGSGVYGLTPSQMKRDQEAARILKEREDIARTLQARKEVPSANPGDIIGAGAEGAKKIGSALSDIAFIKDPQWQARRDAEEKAKKEYYETTQGAPSKAKAAKEQQAVDTANQESYKKISEPYKEPTPKTEEPSYLSRGLDALGHLLQPSKSSAAEETQKQAPHPKAKVQGVESKNTPHIQETAKRRKYEDTRGTETNPINPEAPDPREVSMTEHQKVVDEASAEAKAGALPPLPEPTSAPQETGVTALPTQWENKPGPEDYKEQIRMLQELYQGNRTGQLSPETASRLAAMEDQATRDKWLGALTGFGAGLFGAETPYMSQAIASGAMKGLSAYQQGAQNEEQAALRMLQAQMGAEKEPEEARQKALSAWMQGQIASGKTKAEIQKEMMRGMRKQAELGVTEAGKDRRAAMNAKSNDELKQMLIQSQITGNYAALQKIADDKAAAEIQANVITDPREQENIRQKWRREYNIPTFAGTGSFTGLGGGTGLGGRPIIMGTQGQILGQ